MTNSMSPKLAAAVVGDLQLEPPVVPDLSSYSAAEA